MKPRIPASTWAEIRTAYASGIGLRELARNMGIPAGTVLARAKRECWTGQIQAAKALACSASQTLVRTTTEAVAATMQERGQRHVQRMAGIVEKTLPHVEGLDPAAILDRVEDLDRLDRIGRRTFGIRDGEVMSGSVLVNIDLRGLVLSPMQSPAITVGE